MLASLYFIVLCASSLLLIALSFVGWTRRRLPSGTSFFLLMASSAFYLVCNVGFMISADRETAYLFARLQTLGINLACVHLLVFSLAHTGRRHRLTLAALAPWYALAIGTFLVVWTDPAHHWYFRSFDIQRIDGLTFRTGSYGWWLPVLIGIQFIPPLYGVALLTLEYRAAQGILRRQFAWLIITACLPPAVSAVIALLRMLGIEALTRITPLPLALTAVGLSTLRVVLRDQLLDLMPIAQPLIFDEIPGGDHHHRLTGADHPAQPGCAHAPRIGIAGGDWPPFERSLPRIEQHRAGQHRPHSACRRTAAEGLRVHVSQSPLEGPTGWAVGDPS
ncbi:MAG: hypothetical protein IPK19_37110 [Chloroflexi bacterium]|nr:hypothetical protein [Chloroflexota bacterium]